MSLSDPCSEPYPACVAFYQNATRFLFTPCNLYYPTENRLPSEMTE